MSGEWQIVGALDDLQDAICGGAIGGGKTRAMDLLVLQIQRHQASQASPGDAGTPPCVPHEPPHGH